VRRLLGDTAPKREALFDFSGLEFNLQPENLVGREIYVLFHRGMPLDRKLLSIQPQGELALPQLDGQPLEDGVWLLLRFRKGAAYSGFREWFDTARAWRGKLQSLVDDVQLGATAKEDALKRLRPSISGDETLFDEYTKLRAIIINDGVLTELEARTSVAGLRAALASAAKAVEEQSGAVFRELAADLRDGLLAGRTSGGAGLDAFREAFHAPMPEREAGLEGLEAAQPALAVEDAQLVPSVVEEATRFDAPRARAARQKPSA
jgi:hypothetical protein